MTTNSAVMQATIPMVEALFLPKIPVEEVIRRVEAESIAALDLVADCKITSDAEYSDAGELLKAVKRMGAELEAARTAVTKPVNEHLRQFNALFSPTQARLDLIESRFKALTSTYVRAKAAEQQRLLREAAVAAMAHAAVTAPLNASPAQVEAARTAAADAVLSVHATMSQAALHAAPSVAGISHTERWDWAVADLSLVPREFLMVDQSKVTAAVKAGTRQIAGVNIFPVTQTRVVSGKS